MYLPNPLYLFWRNCIYLRSTGWELTRKRIFKQQGEYCQRCGSRSFLNVHHINHDGQVKPHWTHFLPFARWFMWKQDYSKLIVLCHYHHALAHAGKK